MAEALLQTRHHLVNEGDLMVWWLSEMVHSPPILKYVEILERSNRPLVAAQRGEVERIKGILEGLQVAQLLFEGGQKEKALATVEDELVDSAYYKIMPAAIFSPAVPLEMKILMARAVRNMNEKTMRDRTRLLLDHPQERIVWPLKFVTEAQGTEKIASRAVSVPRHEVSFTDLFIDADDEAACHL